MDILQFLQQQGKSRRLILQQLQEWLIMRNGKEISRRKETVSLNDIITIKSRHSSHNEETFTYTQDTKNNTIILFNKPVWYVVSKNDPHNETIYDILPTWREKKYTYIGRLDKDSHGLLILTDIHQLVSSLSHPRYLHKKTYIIKVDHDFSLEGIMRWKTWIHFIDPDTQQKIILCWESCEKVASKTYKVILQSWKKRHIRRLCEALGNYVVDLKRIWFWPRNLNEIQEWQWETISLHQVDLENLLKS